MSKKSKKEKDLEIPMTSIIRHRVQVGRETDFAEWSRGISKSCKSFTGCTGTKYIYPADPGEEYVTIIGFDSYENYQRWQNSPERMKWLHGLRGIMEGEVSREFIRGFEYWIGNESDSGKTWPPDFKMVLIAYFAIWPLTHFIAPMLQPFLPTEPLLASLLSTAVVTLLMGYLSLPLISRISRRWIMKK
jgi:antibiotic biosynthesis monooxygenase (ABM) superfamily enzyme